MPTPFGTLYSSNITPDQEFGIGRWTADRFYKTMHEGLSPDGGLIYPAMPFASYTRMTRADCDAIFSYLRTVPAVHQPARDHDLRFPYDNRSLLIGWRTLFFHEGESRPTKRNPMSGIVVRIWCRGPVIAPCVTRQSMRWAAAFPKRSKAG